MTFALDYFKKKLVEYQSTCDVTDNYHASLIQFYEAVLERFATIQPYQVDETPLAIVVVAHITDVLPYYLYALSHIAPIAQVIKKGQRGIVGKLAHGEFTRFNSIQTIYEEVILKQGWNVDDVNAVRAYLRVLVESGKQVVICDHGGYFSPIMDREFLEEKIQGSKLLYSIRAITEHTLNGDEKYLSWMDQMGRYPVASVDTRPRVSSIATSAFKQKESKPIGRSIVENLHAEMTKARPGNVFHGAQILIVGYGSIGESVALSLMQLTASEDLFQLSVCDADDGKLRKAKEDLGGVFDNLMSPGSRRFFLDIDEAFKEAQPDIILVATSGGPTVKKDMLNDLQNEVVYFACATSIDSLLHEEALDYLRKHVVTEGQDKNYTSCDIDGRKFNFLRDGRTINFADGSTGNLVIHGVFAYDVLNTIRTLEQYNHTTQKQFALENANDDDGAAVENLLSTMFKRSYSIDAVQWMKPHRGEIQDRLIRQYRQSFIEIYRSTICQVALSEQRELIEDSTIALRDLTAHQVTLRDIFAKLGQPSLRVKKVLLTGKSISGKTNISKLILHHWARGECQVLEPKTVFWVPLYFVRSFVEGRLSEKDNGYFESSNLFLDYVVYVFSRLNSLSIFYQADSGKELLKILQAMVKSDNCFFVVDGLEELEYLASLYPDVEAHYRSVKRSFTDFIFNHDHLATSHEHCHEFHKDYQDKQVLEIRQHKPALRITSASTMLNNLYELTQFLKPFADGELPEIEAVISSLMAYCFAKQSGRAGGFSDLANQDEIKTLAKNILMRMSYNGIYDGLYHQATLVDIRLKIQFMASLNEISQSLRDKLNDDNMAGLRNILYVLTPILRPPVHNKMEKVFVLQFAQLQLLLAAQFIVDHPQVIESSPSSDHSLGSVSSVKFDDARLIRVHQEVFQLCALAIGSDNQRLHDLLDRLIGFGQNKRSRPIVMLVLLTIYRIAFKSTLGSEEKCRIKQKVLQVVCEWDLGAISLSSHSALDSNIFHALIDEYERHQDGLLGENIIEKIIPKFSQMTALRLLKYLWVFCINPASVTANLGMLPPSMLDDIEIKWNDFGAMLSRRSTVGYGEPAIDPAELFTSLPRVHAEKSDTSFYDVLLKFSKAYSTQSMKFDAFMKMVCYIDAVHSLEKKQLLVKSLVSSLLIAVNHNNQKRSIDDVVDVRKSAIVLLTHLFSYMLLREFKEKSYDQFLRMVQNIDGDNGVTDRVSLLVSLLVNIVSLIAKKHISFSGVFEDGRAIASATVVFARYFLRFSEDLYFNLINSRRGFIDVLLGHRIIYYCYAYGLLANLLSTIVLFFQGASVILSVFVSLLVGGTVQLPIDMLPIAIYISYFFAAFFRHLLLGFTKNNIHKYIMSCFSFDYALDPIVVISVALTQLFVHLYSYMQMGDYPSYLQLVNLSVHFVFFISALFGLIRDWRKNAKISSTERAINNFQNGMEIMSKTVETFTLNLMYMDLDDKLLIRVVEFVLIVTPMVLLKELQSAASFFFSRVDEMRQYIDENRDGMPTENNEVMSFQKIFPVVRHHMGVGGYFFEEVKAFTHLSGDALFIKIYSLLRSLEAPKRGMGIYLFLITYKNHSTQVEFSQLVDIYTNLLRDLLQIRVNETDIIVMLIDFAINVILSTGLPGTSTNDGEISLKNILAKIYESLEDDAARLRFLQSLLHTDKSQKMSFTIQPGTESAPNCIVVDSDILQQPAYPIDVVSNRLRIVSSAVASGLFSTKHRKTFSFSVSVSEEMCNKLERSVRRPLFD